MRKKQKDWAKDMAYQRIIRLFELARTEFKKIQVTATDMCSWQGKLG